MLNMGQYMSHIAFAQTRPPQNFQIKNCGPRDFPGGPVVKDPPSSAGDVGSIPGRGTKIPHAAGQLTKLTRHNY